MKLNTTAMRSDISLPRCAKHKVALLGHKDKLQPERDPLMHLLTN